MDHSTASGGVTRSELDAETRRLLQLRIDERCHVSGSPPSALVPTVSDRAEERSEHEVDQDARRAVGHTRSRKEVFRDEEQDERRDETERSSAKSHGGEPTASSGDVNPDGDIVDEFPLLRLTAASGFDLQEHLARVAGEVARARRAAWGQ